MTMRLLRAYAALFSAIFAAFRLPRVYVLLLSCLMIALTQAAIFARVEGWSFLDAFYFAAVSMATVGYGDLAPQTSLGKLLAIAFLVISIGMFVLAVSAIAHAILQELFVADEHEQRVDMYGIPANRTNKPVRNSEQRKRG
jgi:voltage-gated potassium channel